MCCISLEVLRRIVPEVNKNILDGMNMGPRRIFFVRLYVCVYKIKRIARELFTLLYKAVHMPYTTIMCDGNTL